MVRLTVELAWSLRVPQCDRSRKKSKSKQKHKKNRNFAFFGVHVNMRGALCVPVSSHRFSPLYAESGKNATYEASTNSTIMMIHRRWWKPDSLFIRAPHHALRCLALWEVLGGDRQGPCRTRRAFFMATFLIYLLECDLTAPANNHAVWCW